MFRPSNVISFEIGPLPLEMGLSSTHRIYRHELLHALRTNLLRIPLRHPSLHLPQTFTHKQYPIDEQSICWTLDFEISEQRIRTKEAEDLI